MAIRLSQERLQLSGDTATGQETGAEPAAALPAAGQDAARQRQDATAGSTAMEAGGGEDEDGEGDAAFPGDESTGPGDEDELYAVASAAP